MPPGGGPPRNTPIPGQSTEIPGNGPAFHGVPTAGAFINSQGNGEGISYGNDGPPPIKPKKDRNYGFWIIAFLIVVPTLVGIGAAVWGVLAAKDAVDTANDKINEISIPDFPDLTFGDGSGTDEPGVSLLLGGGPAATAAALDSGIPGDPTNFIEILLYPEYHVRNGARPCTP